MGLFEKKGRYQIDKLTKEEKAKLEVLYKIEVYPHLSALGNPVPIKEQALFAGEDALRNAVRREPGEFTWHYNLASIYYKLGKFGDAVVSGEKALGLHPDDPRAEYALASFYNMLIRAAYSGSEYKDWATQVNKLYKNISVAPGGKFDPEEASAALKELGITWQEAAQRSIMHFKKAISLGLSNSETKSINSIVDSIDKELKRLTKDNDEERTHLESSLEPATELLDKVRLIASCLSLTSSELNKDLTEISKEWEKKGNSLILLGNQLRALMQDLELRIPSNKGLPKSVANKPGRVCTAHQVFYKGKNQLEFTDSWNAADSKGIRSLGSVRTYHSGKWESSIDIVYQKCVDINKQFMQCNDPALAMQNCWSQEKIRFYVTPFDINLEMVKKVTQVIKDHYTELINHWQSLGSDRRLEILKIFSDNIAKEWPVEDSEIFTNVNMEVLKSCADWGQQAYFAGYSLRKAWISIDELTHADCCYAEFLLGDIKKILGTVKSKTTALSVALMEVSSQGADRNVWKM